MQTQSYLIKQVHLTKAKPTVIDVYIHLMAVSAR